MRLLVNYANVEKAYLPTLQYLLKQENHAAAVTAKAHNAQELVNLATQCQARFIIISNESTLKQVTGASDATLDEWRGSVIPHKIPMLVVNSLKHTQTVNHGRWLLQSDISKIALYGYPMPKHQPNVVRKLSDLGRVRETLANAVFMSYDIETNGEELDKYYNRATTKRAMEAGDISIEVKPVFITTIAFSFLMRDGSVVSWAMALTGMDSECWSIEELQAVVQLMREVMMSPVPKVAHNGIYDMTHLINYRAYPENVVWDTMGAQHAQYAELPKSLDFTASLWFPHYCQWKHKAKRAGKERDLTRLLEYNTDDTFWTLMIAVMQLCATDNWVHVNNAMTFKMLHPFLYSGFEGAKVDNVVRIKVLEEAVAIKNESLRTLRVMAADSTFNPGSWQQVEALIYDVLGAKKPNIGTSASCTDSKNLNAVAKQHPLLARFTTEILTYKHHQKAIGTYFRYRQRNGRLLYELNPWGTETGRASSRASNFNCGTQVQNIPSYGKAQLVPDDGFVWINADFSKAEAVCVAHIACCKALIKAVTDEERDFYKNLAVIFFHFAYEDVTTQLRNKVMKKIVHGTNYMMGANTFVENMGIENLLLGAGILGISLTGTAPRVPKGNKAPQMRIDDFANFLIETYHKPFPEVRKWYKETAAAISRDGRITSVMGWTRLFFGDPRRHHAVLRSAVAHQPQNLSVFLLNKAMRNVYNKLVIAKEWMGDYRLKGQVHDSIIGQVRKERLQEALQIQHAAMQVPLQFPNIKEPMHIKVDFEISTKSYKDLVEVKYDQQRGQFVLPEVF